MIGKYHIILSFAAFIAALCLTVWSKKEKRFEKEKLLLILLSFIGFLISVYFTLEISRPVWEAVKPMAFLQYPWRFLIMAVFFSSFISGSVLWFLDNLLANKKIYGLVSLAVCIFIIFVSLKFFVPQLYLNKTSNDYTSPFALTWITSKVSDEYMPINFQKPQNYNQTANFLQVDNQFIRIDSLYQKTQELRIGLSLSKDTLVTLPLAYFPSWKANLDGVNTNLSEAKKGVSINIPSGQHALRLDFVQTPLEKTSDFLSIAGILVLFIGIIRFRQKYD